MKKEKKIGKPKNLKEFSKYEKIYNKEDIVLFNSYQLKSEDKEEREKGIMSNLYSALDIPYSTCHFNSAEQLLFFINFVKWGEKVENVPSLVSRISFLMNLKNGQQVKCNPRTHWVLSKIEGWTKKNLGLEQAYFDDWRNLYFIIKMKYKYCEEFRKVLEKYKDKIYCEDSFWGDNFNGVVWDETIQKYRGVNALGRVMKRVYLEENNLI